jgi:phosphatidylinositol alpha-1,6-mannosyltransferase
MGKLPATLWFTRKQLKISQIDSVFLLSGGITMFGLLVLLYCRLTRRRTALLLYGKDILQARRRVVGRLLLSASTRLTRRVFANSWFTASLVPFVRPGKIRVLYPGVDPEIATQAKYSSVASGGTVLFVGRLVRRKGLQDLIDAFSVLCTEMPDVRLEIVGDGPERSRMERLVADLNLGSKVSFLGTLEGIPLYERFSSCDVFAMPSVTLGDDAEGFGTVFLEAGLFGKPSVGTTSGGIPEAVQDGRTGLLVGEGRVKELVLALRKLLTDQHLASSMGKNARERVLEKFTWADSTEQLVRSLKDAK